MLAWIKKQRKILLSAKILPHANRLLDLEQCQICSRGKQEGIEAGGQRMDFILQLQYGISCV
jgi:hypothetical protein